MIPEHKHVFGGVILFWMDEYARCISFDCAMIPAVPGSGSVQSCRIGPVRSPRLQVRTTRRAHLAILVAVATTSVERNPETCTMNQKNTLKKIIPYLLYGVICLISMAVMAFILWIHIKNWFC